MDFDPTALGPILKEALPHIHVVPDGEPRFGISVPASGDVVGEFVDFVYRNYFHDDWQSWARAVWEQECQQVGKVSRFVTIADAYRTAKVRLLATELKDELVQLKSCLARERRKFFPVPAAAELCQLLSHCDG
jgi:hypothetical protein